MDRVSFGRALGYGARHAAKAFVQAADAATAPEPVRPAPMRTAGPQTQLRERTQPQSQVPKPAKRSGQSFLHPLKRYSRTVLLQVVGTFFAVFALLMAQSAWKLRAGIYQPWRNNDAQHFWLVVALLFLFGWFAGSSFVRANRAGRS